ncbi:MAG: hypothetical protein U0807_03415 [Candidatus Binatia bacterium]
MRLRGPCGLLRRSSAAGPWGQPHTILSYRDAFTLLLRFLAAHCGRAVVDLDLVDLEPDAVLTFLHHLEAERCNGPSTRNARLAAVHVRPVRGDEAA